MKKLYPIKNEDVREGAVIVHKNRNSKIDKYYIGRVSKEFVYTTNGSAFCAYPIDIKEWRDKDSWFIEKTIKPVLILSEPEEQNT